MSINHSKPFEAGVKAATQLTTGRLNSLINVQGANTIKPGVGARLSQTAGGSTVAVIPHRQRQSLGRFIVTFRESPETKRLYVSPGAVGKISPDELSGGSSIRVIPDFPTLGGVPLDETNPQPFFNVAAKSGAYEVIWKDTGGAGGIDLRDMDLPIEEDGPDVFQIATLTITPGDPWKVSIRQIWKSDIIWAENGSSSSSLGESSDGSSDGSSGDSGDSGDSDGSEKSSNAIVKMPWHKDGYGALATMESDQVLFEFVIRDVPITGKETQISLDPRNIYLCEKNSITICGAPCGDLPYPVGASIRGNVITLTGYSRSDRRPSKVTFKITGIRRGFKNWQMPSRTREQFIENEKSLQAMYKR